MLWDWHEVFRNPKETLDFDIRLKHEIDLRQRKETTHNR
jgi:hypothetical protein